MCQFLLMSYINMQLPFNCFLMCYVLHCSPTKQQCCHNVARLLSILLDSILVPSVMYVSVLFTELHKHAYPIVLVVVRKCVVYINYENIVMRLWYSIARPNILCISLSISELHEHTSLHCSLLWYEKGIVYQQIITRGVSNYWTLLLYHVSCM